MKNYILKGLPGSGKSTRARQMMDDNPLLVRLNKDDLRAMMLNSWDKKKEQVVVKVQMAIMKLLNEEGYDVVIDDTNLNPATYQNVLDNTPEWVTTETIFIDTPIWDCLSRNAKREKKVPEKVIWEMYSRNLNPWKNGIDPYEDKRPLPWAVIIDVDGSLCHAHDRDIYDGAKAITDTPDRVTVDLFKKYKAEGKAIIVMSGREDKYRAITEQWLEDHNLAPDMVLMRKEGDKRPDYEVKEELYNEHLADKYRIWVALDDRDQIIQLWRRLGIKAIQLEYGNF